jgi:hypothetical protein
MAIPFRLIALGLLVVTLLFSIVAAATRGWIVASDSVQKLDVGLFNSCFDDGVSTECESTLDRFDMMMVIGAPESCKSRDRAAQAFTVIAIMLLFPLVLLVFVRRFLASNALGIAVAAKVPPLVDIVVTAVILFCLTVSWGAFANLYKACVCDPFEGLITSCGLNYSFALAILAWFATAAAAVLMFLGRNESSGYSDVSAPLPN